MSRNKNKSKLTVAAGRLVKQDRRETRTDWLVRPLTLFFSFSEWQVLRNYKTRGSRIGAAQKGRRHRKSIYIVWNRGASTMPGLGVLHGSVSPSFRSHGSALSWSFSETISTGKGESAVDRVSKLQTRQLKLIYFEAELERPGQFVSFSFSVDHIEYRFFFWSVFRFFYFSHPGWASPTLNPDGLRCQFNFDSWKSRPNPLKRFAIRKISGNRVFCPSTARASGNST